MNDVSKSNKIFCETLTLLICWFIYSKISDVRGDLIDLSTDLVQTLLMHMVL